MNLSIDLITLNNRPLFLPRRKRAVHEESILLEEGCRCLANPHRVETRWPSVTAPPACAIDPDDGDCKELQERKKQRLEQMESERTTPFDLQENSRPLAKSATRSGSKWNQSMTNHVKPMTRLSGWTASLRNSLTNINK